MGTDHSAYAPVRDQTGEIIGVVIVGVYVRSMAQVTMNTVLCLLGIGIVAAGYWGAAGTAAFRAHQAVASGL